MSDAIDQLYGLLRPSLRGVSQRELRGCLDGLEHAFAAQPRRRTQLTVRRLRFGGDVQGTFHFYPGVNVLRAGNDKGKSSVLKMIALALTGKNDLKKDVDRWIHSIELTFELDGVPHTVHVDKQGRRPRGRLLRGTAEAHDSIEPLLQFRSGKEMQTKLEAFFNDAFGLRPLHGTQKDARKGSDALLDSITSYRAYFRGMYINQDLGYSDLITEGVPYGNLFMKVVGMLLGLHGLDAYFAVEARLARLENQLAKEERYHRRLEAAYGPRDLATMDEEIKKLEAYIDELKVQRAALLVRATSSDLDQRLADVTQRIVGLDRARQEAARTLHDAELGLADAARAADVLAEAVEGFDLLQPITPTQCPTCSSPLAANRGPLTGVHMHVGGDPAQARAAATQQLTETRARADAQRDVVGRLETELEEIEVRAGQLVQQKRHLQAQLRAAHQGTEELEREIELETRYLGRLEAERDSAAHALGGDDDAGTSSEMQRLLRRKHVLDAVLRHLRTHSAARNEQLKEEFARRVQHYCTTIGFSGLEQVTLDAQLQPRVRQNRTVYAFDELSPGEKVRFVLAFHLALAITTGEDLDTGAHPGLLLIDSPGKEEMVHKDFEAVVHLLNQVERHHANSIQVLVATTLPAIRSATDPSKQHFVDNDEEPLFR
ncbi:MAG: AAA family ATPase [Acidobacteriota bacterium]